MDIVKVENAVKRFGDYTAVDNISFNVPAGKVYGLLGPNGAGKTTTIRMITNILFPDSGEIKLFGEKAGANHQNMIGYLPEERGLYKKLKVIDQIAYFGMLKGMSRAKAQEVGKEWLRKMDALDWQNKKIQELSKGMQQKVQFISTIVHSPKLLILDEPFSGFDPINTELLKRIILDKKEEGCTIILSTHIMEQAEQLCDEICLINKGNVVLQGVIRDIKKRFGKDTVLMEFDGDDKFLDDFTNLKFINRNNHRVEFRINENTSFKEILEKANNSVNLNKFELMEPSLNEIFIDVVTQKGQL